MGSAAEEGPPDKEAPRKPLRRAWRRLRSAAGNAVADFRYRLGRKPDYISRQLRDDKANARARRLIASTHALNWLQILLLVALLVVGVLLLKEMRSQSPPVVQEHFENIDKSVNTISVTQRQQSQTVNSIDSRLTALTNDFTKLEPLLLRLGVALARGGPSTVETASTRTWSFFGFAPGSSLCVPAVPETASLCGLKSGDAGTFDSLVKALSEPASGPTLVLITGGHDNSPLTGRLQREIGTNIQLGQLRADSVRRTIEHALDQAVGQTARKSLTFIAVPRGASTVHWPTERDRGVTINVIRMGKA